MNVIYFILAQKKVSKERTYKDLKDIKEILF